MGFYFMRTGKVRQFNHVPIYYDKDKEELEKMKRNAEIEVNGTSGDSGTFKPNVKGQFSKRRINESIQFGADQRRKSNLRLVMIIIGLLLIGYLIINSGSTFIEALIK